MTSIPLVAGHDDVQEHDVGLVLDAPRRSPRSAVAGLADGLDVRLGVEHAAQARPDDCVVVDDENADGHRTWHLGRER